MQRNKEMMNQGKITENAFVYIVFWQFDEFHSFFFFFSHHRII